MNESKAKHLRQLVKHLMTQGAIAPTGWAAYAPEVRPQVDERTRKVSKFHAKDGVESYSVTTHTVGHPGLHFSGTVRLDPACGRAIYQQMKKRAHSHRAS